MVKTAERLRALMANADRSGSGRPYAPELRREVVAYVEARRGQGVGRVAAAREIGVSAFSVTRWTAALGAGVRSGFREVMLAERSETAVSSEARRLIIHGPCGLRIEGLDVAGVAELWRRLS
jgi:hypothetical protein